MPKQSDTRVDSTKTQNNPNARPSVKPPTFNLKVTAPATETAMGSKRASEKTLGTLGLPLTKEPEKIESDKMKPGQWRNAGAP
ncbi:hypothetical protein MMC07_005805 [Pseudocyphellaria aurata]|nr:hypothetical protein [Pseudocyphellaria aurata]